MEVFLDKSVLKLCSGRKLIDVKHNNYTESCVDDSEEVVLLFEDGYEVNIYFNSGTHAIHVEGD